MSASCRPGGGSGSHRDLKSGGQPPCGFSPARQQNQGLFAIPGASCRRFEILTASDTHGFYFARIASIRSAISCIIESMTWVGVGCPAIVVPEQTTAKGWLLPVCCRRRWLPSRIDTETDCSAPAMSPPRPGRTSVKWVLLLLDVARELHTPAQDSR